ncbi:hypothetical protein PR048_019184 [Dryococelus australis]|uniref:Uncharacterized protein n=1 Tax=Dryococelus australis TaxID=614101 RepID=A0ABQ9H328_9NEOP|nr:hypothetical protein PR048_019184 [Dryococelus australis]
MLTQFRSLLVKKPIRNTDIGYGWKERLKSNPVIPTKPHMIDEAVPKEKEHAKTFERVNVDSIALSDNVALDVHVIVVLIACASRPQARRIVPVECSDFWQPLLLNCLRPAKFASLFGETLNSKHVYLRKTFLIGPHFICVIIWYHAGLHCPISTRVRFAIPLATGGRRGGRAISTLASHLGEPGSIPGRVNRTFARGNRAGRCRWSVGLLGDLPSPPPFIQAPLHTHLNHPHRLGAAQISSLTRSPTGYWQLCSVNNPCDRLSAACGHSVEVTKKKKQQKLQIRRRLDYRDAANARRRRHAKGTQLGHDGFVCLIPPKFPFCYIKTQQRHYFIVHNEELRDTWKSFVEETVSVRQDDRARPINIFPLSASSRRITGRHGTSQCAVEEAGKGGRGVLHPSGSPGLVLPTPAHRLEFLECPSQMRAGPTAHSWRTFTNTVASSTLIIVDHPKCYVSPSSKLPFGKSDGILYSPLRVQLLHYVFTSSHLTQREQNLETANSTTCSASPVCSNELVKELVMSDEKCFRASKAAVEAMNERARVEAMLIGPRLIVFEALHHFSQLHGIPREFTSRCRALSLIIHHKGKRRKCITEWKIGCASLLGVGTAERTLCDVKSERENTLSAKWDTALFSQTTLQSGCGDEMKNNDKKDADLREISRHLATLGTGPPCSRTVDQDRRGGMALISIPVSLSPPPARSDKIGRLVPSGGAARPACLPAVRTEQKALGTTRQRALPTNHSRVLQATPVYGNPDHVGHDLRPADTSPDIHREKLGPPSLRPTAAETLAVNTLRPGVDSSTFLDLSLRSSRVSLSAVVGHPSAYGEIATCSYGEIAQINRSWCEVELENSFKLRGSRDILRVSYKKRRLLRLEFVSSTS